MINLKTVSTKMKNTVNSIRFHILRRYRQTDIPRDTEVDTISEYKNQVLFIYQQYCNSVRSFVYCVYSSLSTTTDRAWCAPSLLYNAHHISFLGTNLPGCGTGHSHTFCTEVKERIELCYYSFYWFKWPVPMCLVTRYLDHYAILKVSMSSTYFL
jgi:hypothetical protein